MRRYLIIFIIFVLSFLSLVLGFIITKKDKIVEVERKIPLPNEFTANPSLQQLNANIKGKIVEKGEDSFILEYERKRVTLYIEPRGLTTFARGDYTNEIPYSEVSVGDYVEGGVSIIISRENTVGRSGNRKQGDIVAHFFRVIAKQP